MWTYELPRLDSKHAGKDDVCAVKTKQSVSETLFIIALALSQWLNVRLFSQ